MPTIDVGGVEKNFILISNYLVKKFKKVSVITVSKDKKTKFEKKIKFITYKKLNISNLPRRVKFLFGLLLLFFEIIKNKKNLVVCFQANIYCIYLCKILRTKIIVRSNSAPEGWSQNFLKKIIYKNALSLADSIIVNSFEFKKSIKKKFNLNSNCIYNPVNTFEIIKKSKENISFSFFKKKYYNFISVARFAEQKDHITLLKGIQLLNGRINYKLLLIGEGEKEMEIKNFIKNKNLQRNVKIINSINNPFPYIRISDAFILSSKYEGLPNVLLESIVLNKFTISSNCPTGPSEILDNGKGGLLFKTKDPKDLAKKIIYFVKNKKKCNQKLHYAKKRIIRFDKNTNLLKYEILIKSFLKNI